MSTSEQLQQKDTFDLTENNFQKDICTWLTI